MPTDVKLPPAGPYASAIEIESWIESQARLTAVATAAISVLAATKLGSPRRDVGPLLVARDHLLPTHLRRGAVWQSAEHPRLLGLTVCLFGPSYRVQTWGVERTATLTSTVVTPAALAGDVWSALVMVDLLTGKELPVVNDGHGNVRKTCRLGCDMHATAPGKFTCSCKAK